MIENMYDGLKALVTIPGKTKSNTLPFGRKASADTVARSYTASVWAYRCARIVANIMSTMPWGLFEGTEEVEKTHPGVKQLLFVNEKDNFPDLIKSTTLDIKIHGFAVWWLEIFGTTLVRYRRIPAKELRAEPMNGEQEPIGFTWTRAGVQSFISRQDVAYFKTYGALRSHEPDGSFTLITDKARSEQNIDQTVVTHFNEYAIPPYVMTSEGNITEKDMKRYKGWWEKLLKSVAKRWNIAFVGGGLKPVRLRAPMRELDLKPLRESLAREICAAIGVPPAIAGLTESVNRSTFKEMLVSMQHLTIHPQGVMIAGVINTEVMPFVFGTPEFRFQPEQVELLQEEKSEKSKRVIAEVEAGIITAEAANKELGYTSADLPKLVTVTAPAAGDNVTKGRFESNVLNEWVLFQSKALRMIEAGNNQNFNFNSLIIPQQQLNQEIEKIRLIEAR